MIERGMVKELEDFHRDYNLQREEPADYTLGIFQSIGFKEFHKYLMLPDDATKSSPTGQKLYKEGVELMNISTHQYAKRQLRWIRQRFLNPMITNRFDVYEVDSTDPSQWEQKVLFPAMKVIQSFIDGKKPEMEPVEPIQMPPERLEHIQDLNKIFYCSTCDRSLQGIEQLNIHMEGKKHKSKLKKEKAPTVEKISFKLNLSIDEIMREELQEDSTLKLKILKLVKKTFKVNTTEAMKLISTLEKDLSVESTTSLLLSTNAAEEVEKNFEKLKIMVKKIV